MVSFLSFVVVVFFNLLSFASERVFRIGRERRHVSQTSIDLAYLYRQGKTSETVLYSGRNNNAKKVKQRER